MKPDTRKSAASAGKLLEIRNPRLGPNATRFWRRSEIQQDRTFFRMKSSLNVLHPAHTCLAFAMALACPPALAQDSDRLVELINQYRKSPQRCSGAMLPAASALSPDRNLARVNVSQGGELQKALKDAGYQAARAEAIVLTGVQTPDVAMKAITEAYCRSVMKQQYSAIGVSRHGNTWRIVFARPLLSSDMRDPLSSGKQVLALVNTARGKPRMCGDRRFSAAPPLEWNDTLAKAALVHSRDMADRNYFRHEATDGSQVGDRAQRAGYRWQSVGENIAAGQGSAQQVVEGWLSSPGHCANIMNRGFTEMGAAYALNQNSDASIYWTQVFGRPR